MLLFAALAGDPSWRTSTPERELRGRTRVQADVGWGVVDKNGVPDALRVGGRFGVLLWDQGPLGLSVDVGAHYGHSEEAGWSLKAGSDVEVEGLFVGPRISAYGSVGLHYFLSRSDEDRSGLLGRAAAGVRFMAGSRVFVGFEPLALERLPDGPGPHTPLRSRWAWGMTFLSIGVRP
jgi:hypothetical protein